MAQTQRQKFEKHIAKAKRAGLVVEIDVLKNPAGEVVQESAWTPQGTAKRSVAILYNLCGFEHCEVNNKIFKN